MNVSLRKWECSNNYYSVKNFIQFSNLEKYKVVAKWETSTLSPNGKFHLQNSTFFL